MTGVPGTPRHRGDRGSASLWVLSCALLLAVVAAVATVRTLAVLARHRVETAADLAALAAAGEIGVRPDGSCAAARRTARLDRATVSSCTAKLGPDGRTGTVRVRVTATVHLPIVGAQRVQARAVAGRVGCTAGDVGVSGARAAAAAAPSAPGRPVPAAVAC